MTGGFDMSKLPLCAELVAIPGHVYVCVAGGGGGVCELGLERLSGSEGTV